MFRISILCYFRPTSILLAALWAAFSHLVVGGEAHAEMPKEKAAYRFELSDSEWPLSVAFSLDGRKVFAGTNAGRLWEWERKKGAVPRKVKLTQGGLGTGSVDSLAISPDGTRALAGCADDRIRLVDLATLKVMKILRGHDNPVYSVCFSRDGQRAFSGSTGGPSSTIIQWDLKTGKSLRLYRAADMAESLALSPDEGRFITTEFMAVQEWNAESGKRLRVLQGHTYRVHEVLYSHNDQQIVSVAWDEVRVWDAKSGKTIRTIRVGELGAEDGALSPDGRHMVLGALKEMRLLDLKTGQEIKRWTGLYGNVRVAISPDGKYALSGEAQGPVSLWPLPSGSLPEEHLTPR